MNSFYKDAWRCVLIFLLMGCSFSDTKNDSESINTDPNPPSSEIVTIKASGANKDSLLGIPRYKIVQSSLDPKKIWLAMESDSGLDTYYSSDGGDSWNWSDSQGWERHLSIARDGDDNIHFINRGDPGEYLRLVNKNGSLEFNPAIEIDAYTQNDQTSGNINAVGSDVIIFTRNANDDQDAVKYYRSTNNGESWNGPYEIFTPVRESRIGSVIIDGAIALVSWNEGSGTSGDPNTIKIYRYDNDTNGFSADTDAIDIIWDDNMTRQYSTTQTQDGWIHVVWVDQVQGEEKDYQIRHSYKKWRDSWPTSVTVEASYQVEMFPLLSAWGNSLFMVYIDEAKVYLKEWNFEDGWASERLLISAQDAKCRYVQIPQYLPADADSLPIVWLEQIGATDDYSVNYKAIYLTERLTP
ncbi:hypothetical protein B4O97_15895 [Marispirochaeta aestuarii]|uniref:Sialidase domain-containing protein n=1 Tax=Marispirochaeta aestuarii TaxID=1963862 RepID=A0A1Y1RUD4_9SPIO|nr:hypothetical protein [Marispirochaeta aestuarii]ORC32640.1 hypothetical protein B4O97_15895 [Marispirochaeta aestuarii]